MLSFLQTTHNKSYLNQLYEVKEDAPVISYVMHEHRAVMVIETILKNISKDIEMVAIQFDDSENTPKITKQIIKLKDKSKSKILSELGFSQQDSIASFNISKSKLKKLLSNISDDTEFLKSRKSNVYQGDNLFPLGFNGMLWVKAKMLEIGFEIKKDFTPFSLRRGFFGKNNSNYDIIEAAKKGDCEMIRMAIDEGVDPNFTVKRFSHKTPLWYAEKNKQILAIFLLEFLTKIVNNGEKNNFVNN